MTPNYVYRAYFKEVWGQRIEVALDLGFGRSVPYFFYLCDVAPRPDDEDWSRIQGFIDTWMREDRSITVESIRKTDHYEAHVYRDGECLNVLLRESGFAIPA